MISRPRGPGKLPPRQSLSRTGPIRRATSSRIIGWSPTAHAFISRCTRAIPTHATTANATHAANSAISSGVSFHTPG